MEDVLSPSKIDDAEIERQVQEAMGGLDPKALYGEPTPRPRRRSTGGGKKGRVVALHADDIFVDVGGRSQGVLPASHFPEGKPNLGDEVEVVIEGYDQANGLLLLARKGAATQVQDWSSVAEGMVVEGRVTGTNKGGLDIEINGIRGFMPVSHIELFRVEDTRQYVNQRLRCLVTDVNPREKNLVVSRRALLEKEREEAREKLWQELAEGQVRTGTVRSVRDFGAFVDLGGADGLLHVSEMSWTRVDNAADVVQPGQEVQVFVLKVDRERRKISLGLKQLLEDPWSKVAANYVDGTIVKGKVTKLMNFGAFVELEPGIEGLVHISELAPQRVNRVGDVVQPGQEVEVKVLKVDPQQRRISLSIKQARPQEGEPAQEPEDTGKTKRGRPTRQMPLKGGLG